MLAVKRLFAILSLVFVAACGGGGGDAGTSPFGSGSGGTGTGTGTGTATALFTSAPANFTVPVGSTTQEYTISGGSPAYSVTSSNAAVASVGVNASKFVVNGAAGGKASLIIKDALGASVAVDVTVGSATPLYTTAPSQISLAVGATQSYAIGGGAAPYTASSSNSGLASVAVTGSMLNVTGVASGTTNVVVRDATGALVTIAVTVGSSTAGTALFTSAASDIVVGTGTTPNFTIGGGTGPYTASSSNVAISRAVIFGSTTLSITGVAAGAAKVVVLDAVGAKVEINVLVGTGSLVALYTTAPTPVTISSAVLQSYSIGGGVGPYVSSSSNVGVATAAVSGSTLTVVGVASGAAQVAIFDSTGKSVLISVVVPTGGLLYTSAPSAVVIATGVSASYVIGGGVASYTATSSNAAIASASVVGTSMTITGVGAGTAKVSVRDAVGGLVTINVTVGSSIPLFSSAPAALTIAPARTQLYTVGGGEGPYLATSSNEAFATASVSGTTLSISGVAAGASSVVVTDALGATVTIAVTVTPAASIPLAVTPLAATASVGDTLTFTITGGDPTVSGGIASYTVTINNPSIATVAVTGSTFTAKLLNAGATTIAIIDSKGQTQTVILTVNQLQPLLRLSPLLVAISEFSTAAINLDAYGGVGPYTAYTSDLRLSSVSVAGSRITVGLGSQLNRCIDSTTPGYIGTLRSVEPYNTSVGTVHVVITVVDANGRSTFSDLFIVDNGGTCP